MQQRNSCYALAARNRACLAGLLLYPSNVLTLSFRQSFLGFDLDFLVCHCCILLISSTIWNDGLLLSSVLPDPVYHIPIDKHPQKSPDAAQDSTGKHIPWIVRPYVHACEAYNQGYGI
jgi:hypothetical protein